MPQEDLSGISVGEPEDRDRQRAETSRLNRVQVLFDEYHTVLGSTLLSEKSNIDQSIIQAGFNPDDIFSSDGWHFNQARFEDFLKNLQEAKKREFLDFLDSKDPNRRWFIASDRKEINFTSVLDDLKGFKKIESFIYNNASSLPSRRNQYSPVIASLRETEGYYRMICLRLLLEEAVDSYEDDSAKNFGIPDKLDLDSLDKDGRELATAIGDGFLTSIKELASLVTDQDIKSTYQEVIEGLRQESLSCIPDYFRNRWGYDKWPKMRDSKESLDVDLTLHNFIHTFRGVLFDSLNLKSNQLQKLYDLTATRLMSTLYQGGHESWDGTYAANIFWHLRDPRALPGLIHHLRMFGSGHTSAFVAECIGHIIQDPSSAEEFTRVVAEASELDQKIIKNWYLNQSTLGGRILKRVDTYAIAGMVQNAESYMAFEKLAELAEKLAEAKNQPIESNLLEAYFFGRFDGWFHTEVVDNLLLSDLGFVAKTVATSHITNWRVIRPFLFNRLVNPEDGNYLLLPQAIAQDGLGISVDMFQRLQDLYNRRGGDLQRGALARATFAEGLLFLTTKQDGREVLEKILGLTKGSREDPARVRTILGLLQTLGNFGSYEFVSGESLREVVERLRDKVVLAVKDKMHLNDSILPILSEKLDRLIGTGLFEIIPAIAAQYEGRGYKGVAKVAFEIGEHVVLGDFLDWRNNLETSQRQLEVLPEDKRKLWIDHLPEVRLSVNANQDVDKAQAVADGIIRVANEARAHLLDVYKLDFSPKRIEILNSLREQIIKDLKQEGLAVDRRELGERKSSIETELEIVQGLLSLETLGIKQLDHEAISERVSRLKYAMSNLQGLDQPIQDLSQIEAILQAQGKITGAIDLIASETDDPIDLLKVGVEPRETCQSWRKGSFNYCLLSNSVDVNKRIINVKNGQGEILGRAIMKLTHYISENGEKNPVILLEPVYTLTDIPQIYRVLTRMALEKAQMIDASLVLRQDMIVPTGADNKKTIPVVESEARRLGLHVSNQNLEIYIPRSYNGYEYSDSLGGAISIFDTYRPLENALIAA